MDLLNYIYGLVSLITLCHGHAGHGTGNEDVARPNKEHVAEHLKEGTNIDTSKMSAEELEFYHFKLHDSDNNNSLDGLEIYKAIVHQHPEETEEEKKENEKPMTHEELMQKANEEEEMIAASVDKVLQSLDKDGDGYISYIEYKQYNDQVRTDAKKKEGKN